MQRPPINAHTDVSSGARGQAKDLTESLSTYILTLSQQSAKVLVRLRCSIIDKYGIHMCWLYMYFNNTTIYTDYLASTCIPSSQLL